MNLVPPLFCLQRDQEAVVGGVGEEEEAGEGGSGRSNPQYLTNSDIDVNLCKFLSGIYMLNYNTLF